MSIRSIAIVGGGTAGWMAASMLARALPGTHTAITVVESPDIGIIGVGEATIPPIIDVLRFLNIDEADFVRHTEATYKLGIKFADWKTVGTSYWHPFGTFGAPIIRRPFYHAWHKARAAGLPLSFNDYSACATLAEHFKFRFPDTNPDSPAAGLRYALHFDAVLVAKYLRNYAERMGVARMERTVAGASRSNDGLLDELKFSDGSTLKADFYIDCSGFPVTVPWHFRRRQPASALLIRSPRRAAPVGSGASPCSIAPATVMCTPASTAPMRKPAPTCSAPSARRHWPIRASCALPPAAAKPFGAATAWL